MRKPFFSILIPVYNGSKTIAGVLDSIRYQSYKNFEVVIYDDCSRDTSKSIIEGWIKKNKINIILISGKMNRGSYYGLQKCIDAARGNYFIFSAQDNFFMSNRIKVLTKKILNNTQLKIISSDVFIGNYSQYLAGSAHIQKGLASLISPNLFYLYIFRSLIFRFDSTTISRELIKYYPALHKYSPSEDFAFLATIFSRVDSIKNIFLHIKSPLVYVISSKKSQSYTNANQISQASIKFFNEQNFSRFNQVIFIGNIKLIGLIRARSFKKLTGYLFFNPIQSIIGIFILSVRLIITSFLISDGSKELKKLIQVNRKA
jgi:glycosyltransferase involved in cell wall biosynthesis